MYRLVQTLVRSGVARTFLFLISYFQNVDSLKQRSWLGPSQFFEGTVPSPRWLHGFATAEEKLYVFGGYNNNGRLRK